MRKLIPLLSLLLLGCLSGCSEPAQAATSDEAGGATTTLFLVRHAEKDDGEDPDLTAAGSDRARTLAELLAGEELDAVYSSDTRRTRQTAGPTADNHGQEVQIYNPDDLGSFAAELLRLHPGEKVLVVGHSNTTPALANHLTDTDTEAAFDESDYGNLLVVTVPPNGKARLVKRRY